MSNKLGDRPNLPDNPVKFMHRLRFYIRQQGLSAATEKSYCGWTKRFIKYHHLRSPESMNKRHVEQFLHNLVVVENVTINTQKSALNSLAFLFNRFLDSPLGELNITRAKLGPKIPTVLSHKEALNVICAVEPQKQLVLQLLYGSGLRLNEALSLRLRDLDLEANKLRVENGKGGKNRLTILPRSVHDNLKLQIEIVRRLHESDLANGHGWAFSGEHQIDAANKRLQTLPWQFLFPAKALSYGPRSKKPVRYHLSDTSIQRSVRHAANKIGLTKEIGPHSFQHSFATRLLESGTNIRVVQKLLGHACVSTTEIYTHVLHKHGYRLKSPMDEL